MEGARLHTQLLRLHIGRLLIQLEANHDSCWHHRHLLPSSAFDVGRSHGRLADGLRGIHILRLKPVSILFGRFDPQNMESRRGRPEINRAISHSLQQADKLFGSGLAKGRHDSEGWNAIGQGKAGWLTTRCGHGLICGGSRRFGTRGIHFGVFGWSRCACRLFDPWHVHGTHAFYFITHWNLLILVF
jgi:hypothetical protein